MDGFNNTRSGASPYATGGGGTVLEHRLGAVLLGSLLAADPVSGLGDDIDPVEVAFQASSFSPVDDLVVSGRSRDGDLRRLSIGVRRDPSLVPSNAPSVHLVSTFVRVIVERWDDVRRGKWRLQLATRSPNPDVQQLRELANIARATPDDETFRTAVAGPSRPSRAVRDRLVQFDLLVARTASDVGDGAEGLAPTELTWRLLSALTVRELRLEGVDMSDRTESVARLRSATTEGTMQAADALFGKLAELSGHYAPAAAVITEASLRRALGMHLTLARSSRHGDARRTLDRLAERLRQRTGSRLSDAESDLELDRPQARAALEQAMRSVSLDRSALVVCGEPDVGKSALIIAVSDALAGDTSTTMLSLRDLPSTSAETEALLGVPLVDVLVGESVRPGRLLVIDGAESVLEGRGPLLTDLAAAAMAAGLGVVTVARSDAATAVSDAVRQATQNAGAGSATAPVQHDVPRLTNAEIDQVTTRFAVLARLGSEPRARWLLGRPGLTDLLLRAHAAQALPDGALSEADVFAAVWGALVRRRESTPVGGPSPDSRERALLLLARRLLLGHNFVGAEPEALPSLRSDGLLLAAGPTSAWNPGDAFASDLVRDLCVARLLIVDGPELLLEANGPRWALRAARLACQSIIAAGVADSERARTELQHTFDALGPQNGARWAALPLEAMLTLGSAHDVIARAWPALADDDSQGLFALVRVALQRYVQHGIGDPVVLAPLVEVALERDTVRAGRYGRRDDLHELICELVLAWLRGQGLSGNTTNSLRTRLRDRLLANGEDAGDEFVVEALALLGSDLDEAAEAQLRRLAEEGGGDLGPAVESVVAGRTLAQHHPDLLLALTDAYYIDRPRSRSRAASGYSMVDEGVRHHTGVIRMGAPSAGWYFGPFSWLLNARPVESLRVINELLDHAAAIRIGHLDTLSSFGAATEDQGADRGITLELPAGPRLCVGDQHAWMWYRGSSVSPYSAMSALLAVEMFADRLVNLGLSPRRVTELLLHDCHNLAMPGLVVGFLIRHLDRLDDELDPWMARSEVWRLEFARVTFEGHMHVQGPDPTELAGLSRRRFSMRETAMELVTKAILAGNSARVERLGRVADGLLASSHGGDGDSAKNDEERVTRAGWASSLRSENYRLTQQSDGTIIVDFEPPADVLARLASSNTAIARGQRAWGLLTQYGGRDDRSTPTDTLRSDLTFVRELLHDPPEPFGPSAEDVAAAVAATAVVQHSGETVSLSQDEIVWAAAVLAEIALRTRRETFPIESATYVMGATRSAACGLPVLLLDPFVPAPLDRARLERALTACARSAFDEARRMLADGFAPIWNVTCARDSARGDCRHAVALRVVKEMIRDCQLGDWDPTGQQREIRPLEGEPGEALGRVETESLLINRLTAPIAAAMSAARSGCCIAEDGRRLQDELLVAYRRGAIHWDEEGYGSHTGDEHRPVAREMFIAAAEGDSAPLEQCVRDFADHPALIEELLHNVLLVCTYDAELRASLPIVWPGLMRAALDLNSADAREDRRRANRAAAALIPRPSLEIADRDPNHTLEIAQQQWVDPSALTELVEEWIPLVRGDAHAVDALLGLIETGAAGWQAAVGLAWVEDLIGGDYAPVALRSWGSRHGCSAFAPRAPSIHLRPPGFTASSMAWWPPATTAW